LPLIADILGKKQVDDSVVPDVEEEPIESEEERGETVFTFDSFEQVSALDASDTRHKLT
jgi:hypothetical protein